MQRLILAVLAASAVLVASLGTVSAATPKSGTALRQALPDPDDADLRGATEFVGLNRAGKVALAVVVQSNGAVVAFLCDGKTNWVWFTGKARKGKLSLRGDDGSRLVGKIKGRRLNVRVTGARIASARAAVSAGVAFPLQRALDGAGLRRLTGAIAGVSFEGAWVTTNEGRILGVVKSSTTTVAGTNTNSSDGTDNGEAVPPAGSQPEPRLFNRLRCASLVLKFSRNEAALLTGSGGSFQTEQDLKNRFGQLNCLDEGFAL